MSRAYTQVYDDIGSVAYVAAPNGADALAVLMARTPNINSVDGLGESVIQTVDILSV